MTTLDERLARARVDLDSIDVPAPAWGQILERRRRMTAAVRMALLSLAAVMTIVGLVSISGERDEFATRVEVDAPAVTGEEPPTQPGEADRPAGDPERRGWPWFLLLPLIPLLVLTAVLGSFVALPLWALIDAARRPEVAFRRTGQSRTFWLAGISIGTFAGFVPGILLAIAYLVAVRRQLARAEDAAAADSFAPDFGEDLDKSRDPTRVRRRRQLLLLSIALLGAAALVLPSASPDAGESGCGIPIALGADSDACRSAERQQLASGSAFLLAAAIGTVLAQRVPTQQRFRGVQVQLTVGLALVAHATAGSLTAEPEWLRWVLAAAAIAFGGFLTVRACLLIPAQRSVPDTPGSP